MSILQSLRTYLSSYSGLEAGAPLWVEKIGPKPGGYSIVPMPGTKIVEAYLNGGSLRHYPFAFQLAASTANEIERMEVNGFFESLADWFETQTESENLPVLETKKTATTIETTGWHYMAENGQSQVGIYQIECLLTYEQQP